MSFSCGGIFSDCYITHLLPSLTVKEVLKTGQHLAKIWARVGFLFFDSGYSLTRNYVVNIANFF